MFIEVDKKKMLKELRRYKKFTSDAAFARFLEITPQGLATWYARNTFDISKIANKFPEVNHIWLLTGEGEMLKNPAQEAGQPQAFQSELSGDRFDRMMNIMEMQAKQLQTQSEQLKSQSERIDNLIEQNNRLLKELEKQEEREGASPSEAPFQSF